MANAPSSTLGHHHIPLADLDALAKGSPSAESVARLTAAERSRKVLMLRGIAEAEQRRPGRPTGPLEPISVVIARLIDVERRHPEVVAELLGHPAVGLWAARVLVRLHAASGSMPPGFPQVDDKPPWDEFGYAHCVAAAALIRSRTPGVILVPTGPRGIHLPTLGTVNHSGLGRSLDCARIRAEADGTVTVEFGRDRVTLPSDLGQSTPHWRPTPRVLWRPADAPHSLALEDSDLHRDLRPDAEPLSTSESERWQHLLDEAGELLNARHLEAGQMLALTLQTVVPLPVMPPFRVASATYTEAFGRAVISLPHSATELAVTLIHEARHSLLNALNHQIRLLDPVHSPLLYAPWRSDPRPAQGLLHGVYSFAGVAEFWRTERHALTGRHAELAHFEFAVWRRAVAETLVTLRTEGELSLWGRHFVVGIEAQTAAWRADPVPQGPLRRAEQEMSDRWATWRIRNLMPPEDETAELCARWLDGSDPCRRPDHSSLRNATHTAHQEARAELRRSHILGNQPMSHAIPADLCLIRGEATAARDSYVAMLRHDPHNHSAWVGLGLALRLMDEPHTRAAARLLLRRPELARGVHLRIRARGTSPDPVELADWMGR